MPISVSPAVLAKLHAKIPPVTMAEVEQCFQNSSRRYLFDTREKHRTTPPTLWFISASNQQRQLKIVFILSGTEIILKSAFDPNEDELYIYNKYAQR